MFLEEILAYKKHELEAKKAECSLDRLEQNLRECGPARPFAAALRNGSIRLIAEVKKASPSKGLLCPKFNPLVLAKTYEEAGAAAISVLTDEKFFQGSLDYLKLVKEHTQAVPVLRKDFIVDRYQLVEAKIWGADAVLLIVAALNEAELQSLHRQAISLDLTPLVEVHDRLELDLALNTGAKVIGINNRDLKTFTVDLATTYQLLEALPKEITVVSESGIKNCSDIKNLAAAGVNAVLVGESLVTASDPGRQIRELLGEVS